MSGNEEVDYEEETGMAVEAPAAEEEVESKEEQPARGRGSNANKGKGHKGGNKGDVKTKGRGFERRNDEEDDRYGGRGGVFERLEQSNKSGPQQCECLFFHLVPSCTCGYLISICNYFHIAIEGWIIFVSNVHQEAQEDDIVDKFSDYGDVKNIHVNLDRRTGFVKGYALIEFEKKEEALDAIKGMNGQKLLDQTITVDWAFLKK